MPDLIPGTGFARAGLAAMPALDEAPELYAPSPARDDPVSRAATRDDAEFALRAGATATALAGRLRDEPPGMADGLTADRLNRYDEQAAALLEGAPSPSAEDAARAAIQRARGRLVDAVLPQEAAARTVARRQGLIDGLALYQRDAEADPDAADALYAEGAAAIADAADWLGAEQAKQLGDQWRETLYGRSLQAVIAADPDEALQRLATGRYADRLAPAQIAQLRQSAEDRSHVLARDRLSAAAHGARMTDLQRESQRMQFHAQFTQALRRGEARFVDVDNAARDGIISPLDRSRYEAHLAETDAARLGQEDRALRVAGFLDGRRDQAPNALEIQAHFDLVMRPIVQAAPAGEQGRLYTDYFERLGRHIPSDWTANVETGLTPPHDAAVDPQAIYKMLDYDGSTGEVARAMADWAGGLAAAGSALQANGHIKELFAGLPSHNNAVDAYRHAYWNYELTRQFLKNGQNGPEKAKEFADAHEAKHFKETLFGWLPERITGARQWPEDERLMDLFNNEIGRRLATAPENLGRPAQEVIWQALREGKLQTQPMKIGSAQAR
jgi:nicotinamide riboside kinase